MNLTASEPDLGMFKAYDIRTPADSLSSRSAERLAHALAVYFKRTLKTEAVLLARDARLSGSRYLEQGMEIFRSLGFKVLANPLPSSVCLFYHAAMLHPEAAGIFYGASHNPGRDTGQKIIGPGLQPIAMGCGPGGGLAEVRRLYADGVSAGLEPGGSLSLIDCRESYVRYSLELSEIRRGELTGLRAAMDFLSGSAGPEFLQAFEFAGADVSWRNLVPDGSFPAGQPNPVVRESIQPTLSSLRPAGLPFALCFDGDGDRMDLYDGMGRQLSPSFNVANIAKAALAAFPREFREGPPLKFYADLKANPVALVRIARQGLDVAMIRNGHSQIKQSLMTGLTDRFVGAVEESAHYYLNFPMPGNAGAYAATENTLFFALLTAKAWLRHPERYAEAIELQGSTFREREWGYRFPDEGSRAAALEAIEAEFLRRGMRSTRTMADGTEMGATVIRDGLPFVVDASTELGEEWTQIAQRISESESGLARWEVIAGTRKRKEEAVALVDEVAGRYALPGRYVG
jgi:phosphomannomutase